MDVSFQSIPAVVLASIVVFLGFQNLSLFFRRPRRPEHLTFFFACLTIGLYDLSCAFLYSAPSWIEGASWQKMQTVSLAILGALAPWFLHDYSSDILPVSGRTRAAAATLTTILLLAAALVVVNPGGLFWSGRAPRIKTIRIPLGMTIVYNEAELGTATDVLYVSFLVLLMFLAFATLRAYLRGIRKGTLPLAGVIVLLLSGALIDFLVSRGALPFVYTSEYALMGLAMLIAQSLSRKAAGAAMIEERYRSIFQYTRVSLWEGDISGLHEVLAETRARGVTDLPAYLREHPDVAERAARGIRMIDANDATLELFGAKDKAELLGSVGDSLHPSTLSQFAGSVLAIAEGRDRYQTEGCIYTLQGRRLDLIISAHLPRGPEIGNRVFVTMTDITERKRTEEKLRSFLEQSPEAIFLTDEAGAIVEFNPSAEKLVGIRRDAAVGRPVWAIVADGVVPEQRMEQTEERFEARYREAMRSGTADFLNRPIAGVLQRPDGSRRDFVQFVFTIHTGAGYMLGSISHDMTETRRTEEALRLSQEKLRQAQKMEAIGTLAGGIAHDFNNLLTGILGYSTLLLDELPAGSAFLADVQAIEASAQRAAQLTKQILTFSRKDPGIEMRPLDPGTIVEEVARLLERTVDKSVLIRVRLSPEPLSVRANAGQIHQAVLNLCLNACDAMPNGGTLLIETAVESASEIPLTPGEQLSGPCVAISVTDTGAGMEEEVRQRLFEPFFTTKQQGRGLGLSMVYGIVRGHGGEIRVQSELGKGTTFRILLPPTDERRADVAEEVELPRGGCETILVIDDESQVRGTAARILQRAGYTVLLAEDGARGLRTYEERRGEVDLVVLDVSMPGMGGAEVHERLTALKPSQKVILSSGHTEDERIGHIIAKGVRTFLRKPYTARSMLRAVRDALDA